MFKSTRINSNFVHGMQNVLRICNLGPIDLHEDTLEENQPMIVPRSRPFILITFALEWTHVVELPEVCCSKDT